MVSACDEILDRTAVIQSLRFLEVLGLILLSLALSDIADRNEDLTLEWYIAGITIVILSAFTISTFISLRLILKYFNILRLR